MVLERFEALFGVPNTDCIREPHLGRNSPLDPLHVLGEVDLLLKKFSRGSREVGHRIYFPTMRKGDMTLEEWLL